MRFSTIAITVFGAAASASASTLFARQGNIPACYMTCASGADLSATGCQVTDTKCLCENAAFVASTTKCITETCTDPSDLAAAIAVSQELCAKVGVTFTSSPTSAPTSTPTGPSSAPTSTPTSPTTSPTTTPSPTPTGAAMSHGVNTLLGFAAAGLVALAL